MHSLSSQSAGSRFVRQSKPAGAFRSARGPRWFAAGLTLLLATLAVPAFAQQQILDPYLCAEDVSNVGNCTANEVSLSGVTNVTITDLADNPLASCVDGQPIKIATLDAELDSNTGTRYDVTFWIGKAGNDPRISTGLQACAAVSLPDDTGSAFIAHLEGGANDQCLDFAQPDAPIPLSFGGGNAEAICSDSDNDGMADLQIVTTWHQNTNFSCGTGDPLLSPGAPSKCDYVAVPLVPIVDAALTLDKTVTDVGGQGPGASVDAAGDVISYQLLITNSGGATLTNVSAGDPLFESFDPALDCLPALPASLAAGASVTCTGTYTAVQDDIDTSTVINNQAFASADLVGVVNDTASVPIARAISLSLTKQASPTSYSAAGQLISYTFTVLNNGNVTLSNVLVSDPLSGLSAVTCPGGNPIPSLAPDASVDCTATLTTTQGHVDAGSISNTATATGSSPGETNDATDTDNVTINSTATASIEILKSAAPTTFAAAGIQITYTFAVTNTGGETLTNVAVTDPLAGLSPITCGAEANPIADLAPLETVNCTATLTTTQAHVDAGSILNTATATGSSPGNTNDVTDTDNATVNSTATASIGIVKTAAPTTFAATGVLITYTFAVTNTGGQTLTNVLVEDPLSGLSAIDCAPEANPIADLAPAETVNCTATLSTTQADLDAGSIQNTATATGSSPGNTDDVTASDSATVSSSLEPNIQIVKTADPLTYNAAGQTITYSLEVTNTGNASLSNVAVTDPLTGLSVIDCAPEANPIVDLDPLEVVNCTATLTITQAHVDAGSIENTATATGSSPDNEDDVTDSDSATVNSTAGASVVIVKTANPAAFTAAGEIITYTLAVTNDGGVTLTNVLVEDPLSGLSAIDCAPEANPIADLAPAETVNCTATLTITQDQVDAGNIDNTATATGSSPGNANDVTASDSATVTNSAIADYAISKTVTDVAGQGPGGLVSAAGDTITYQITVDNLGEKTLNNVVVTDPLVTLNCNPAAPATLAAGASMVCTGSYVVTQADISNNGNPPGSGEIANTAIVSSDELPDEEDSISVVVRLAPPPPPPPPPPGDVQAIPVNDGWALLLMALLLAAVGWYYRPAVRRNY